MFLRMEEAKTCPDTWKLMWRGETLPMARKEEKVPKPRAKESPHGQRTAKGPRKEGS